MDDPLASLRQRLEETTEWPVIYMYKFIIKDSGQKLIQVKKLFKDSAEISVKKSSGGKYISVTAKEFAANSEEVISKYTEAHALGDIIAL